MAKGKSKPDDDREGVATGTGETVQDAEKADREAERREQEAARARGGNRVVEQEREAERRSGKAQESVAAKAREDSLKSAQAIRAAQGGPPQVSARDIERAREIEAREGKGGSEGASGPPAGETDPASVPTLEPNVVQKMQGDALRARERGEQPPEQDPNRVPTEGEIRANVDMLMRKGDTAYEHPLNSAAARAVESPPRREGQKLYRIIGANQVGAYAGPGRGGPDRAFTLEELWLTDAMVDRLVSKDVIVEEPAPQS